MYVQVDECGWAKRVMSEIERIVTSITWLAF